MAHRFLIIAILFAIAGTARSQEFTIGTIVDSDPSTLPTGGQRFRFRADFNHDGVPDVAVSEDWREFGKMGGSFEIYLGTRPGKWRYVGAIAAHPLALHLEKRRHGEGILTVYLRSSGTAGELIRYSVSERGVKQVSSRVIHPGDGGTDAGRAEYAKYFADTIRLQPELSAPINGEITWSRYDR
jgi:hypothetical protein